MDMINFLKESSTFGGIYFSGNYDMSLDELGILYNHYEETGENLLDSYSEIIYLSWKKGEQLFMDGARYNNTIETVNKLRQIGLIDTDFMYTVIKIADYQYSLYREHNTDKLIRGRASLYTSKPRVRKLVYDKYGGCCLCCGSDNELQIDHVIPVSMGGENKIDNLQLLCKSCNVKKGIRSTDYRNIDNHN